MVSVPLEQIKSVVQKHKAHEKWVTKTHTVVFTYRHHITQLFGDHNKSDGCEVLLSKQFCFTQKYLEVQLV